MSQIKYSNHNHSNINTEKKLGNVCGSCVDGKTKFTQSESKIIAQNIRPNFSASIKWRSISMKKMEQNEDSRSLPEVVIHTVLISQALILSLLGNSLFLLSSLSKHKTANHHQYVPAVSCNGWSYDGHLCVSVSSSRFWFKQMVLQSELLSIYGFTHYFLGWVFALRCRNNSD